VRSSVLQSRGDAFGWPPQVEHLEHERVPKLDVVGVPEDVDARRSSGMSPMIATMPSMLPVWKSTARPL
jgi:hypothetical protein